MAASETEVSWQPVPPEAVTAARAALTNLPTGTCLWGYELTNAAQRAAEAAAPHIAATERKRIFHALFDGDPAPLEMAFRQFVDDDEAADCALAVAELMETATAETPEKRSTGHHG